MSETDDAIKLANKILDRPYGDPDDDLAVVSRQFLRSLEALAALRASPLPPSQDETIKALVQALKHAEPWVESGPAGSWRDGVMAEIAAALALVRKGV